MNEKIDPVTALIEALEKAHPAAEQSGRLAEAAKAIPGRAETAVRDLLDSPELQSFRRAYVNGMVEANLINQAMGLVRSVLAAYGILPA